MAFVQGYRRGAGYFTRSKQASAQQNLDEAYLLMLQSFECNFESQLLERSNHFVQLLVKMKKYAEFESFTIRLLNKDPHNLTYNYWNAISLNHQNKFIESELQFKKCLNISPNDIDSLNGLAFSLKKQLKYNEASSIYRNVIQIKPSNIEALSGLCHCLFEQDKYIECEVIALTLASIDDNQIHYQANYAEVLMKLGKYNKAKQQYLKTFKINPNHPEVISKYIDLLIVTKDWDELTKYIDHTLMYNGFIDQREKAVLINKIGNKYFDLEMYFRALGMYQKSINVMVNDKQKPIHYSVYISNYIFAFHRCFGNEQCIKECELMINKYPMAIGASFYNRFGLIYFDMKLYETARKYYLQAIDLAPHNAIYHGNYISTFLESKQYEKAKQYLHNNKLVDKFIDSAQIQFYAGFLYQMDYKWNLSVKYYDNAIKLKPSCFQYTSNQCVSLCELKEFSTAKNKIEPYLLNNDIVIHWEANYRMGWILKEEGGIYNYIQSEKYFKKCIDLDIDNKHNRVYMAYGHLQYLLNKYNDAIKLFEKSLKITWANEVTHYYYGLLLCKLKKYKESEKHFQIALQLKPNHAESHREYGLMLCKYLNDKNKGMYHILQSNKISPKNQIVNNNIDNNQSDKPSEDQKPNYIQNNNINNSYNDDNDDNKQIGYITNNNVQTPVDDFKNNDNNDDNKQQDDNDNFQLSFANFAGMNDINIYQLNDNQNDNVGQLDDGIAPGNANLDNQGLILDTKGIM